MIKNNAIEFIHLFAASIMGIFSKRNNIHFLNHVDRDSSLEYYDNKESKIFGKQWENILHLNDLDKIAKYLKNNNLLIGNQIRNARFILPCSDNKCKFNIDIPLPPEPNIIKGQIRNFSSLLYNKVLSTEIKTEWLAKAITQEALFSPFCNYPHLGILYEEKHNKLNMVSNTITLELDSSQDSLAYCFDIISNLIERKINDNSKNSDKTFSIPIRRKELLTLLFGIEKKKIEHYPFFSKIINGVDKRHESLIDILQWDRFGRVGNFIEESHLSETAIERDKIHENGLLYHLPITCIYFLSAFYHENPACLYVIPTPIGDDKSSCTYSQLYYAIMVPNLVGLRSFLVKCFKTDKTYSYWGVKEKDLDGIWKKGSKKYSSIVKTFMDAIKIPESIGKVAFLKEKSGQEEMNNKFKWYYEYYPEKYFARILYDFLEENKIICPEDLGEGELFFSLYKYIIDLSDKDNFRLEKIVYDFLISNNINTYAHNEEDFIRKFRDKLWDNKLPNYNCFNLVRIMSLSLCKK